MATAFVGIWGTNFKHRPELSWQWRCAPALAIIAVVCGWMHWRFRKAGWL